MNCPINRNPLKMNIRGNVFVIGLILFLLLNISTTVHAEGMPKILWKKYGNVVLKKDITASGSDAITKNGILYEGKIYTTNVYKVVYNFSSYIVVPLGDGEANNVFGSYTVIGDVRYLVNFTFPEREKLEEDYRTSKMQWYDLGKIEIRGVSDCYLCAFPIGNRVFYKLRYLGGDYKFHDYFISPNVGTVSSKKKYNSTCSMLGKNLNVPVVSNSTKYRYPTNIVNKIVIELGTVQFKGYTLKGEVSAIPISTEKMGYFVKPDIKDYHINIPVKKSTNNKVYIEYNNVKYYFNLYQ